MLDEFAESRLERKLFLKNETHAIEWYGRFDSKEIMDFYDGGVYGEYANGSCL